MKIAKLFNPLLAMIIAGSSCRCYSVEAKHEQVGLVSWVQLAANPERYDDKVILICGWLSVDYSQEEKAIAIGLYLSKEAFDYRDTSLMIWIDAKSLMAQRDIDRSIWLSLKGERVRLQGLFSKAIPDGMSPHRLSKIEHFAQTKPGEPIWKK